MGIPHEPCEGDDAQHTLKVLLIGDPGVGKSCLMQRFVHDEFSEEHAVTVGVEMRVTYLKVRDKEVKLSIHDSSG